jgi:hypothetical protein
MASSCVLLHSGRKESKPVTKNENFRTCASQSDELERLRAAATRFRREARLVERTSKTTLIQWPSAEVDAFIAAFPISEDSRG